MSRIALIKEQELLGVTPISFICRRSHVVGGNTTHKPASQVVVV